MTRWLTIHLKDLQLSFPEKINVQQSAISRTDFSCKMAMSECQVLGSY